MPLTLSKALRSPAVTLFNTTFPEHVASFMENIDNLQNLVFREHILANTDLTNRNTKGGLSVT